MKLAYKAYDGSGKAITGTIDAGDKLGAMESLRRKGLYVADLSTPAASAVRKVNPRRRRVGQSQRVKNVAWFSRQLHVLLCSGTPLVEAIAALERQTRPGPWRDVLNGLRMRMEEGGTVAEAMEAHGAYFDPIDRSLIAAGERSGHLLEMFNRLAMLKQKQLKVRTSVLGALMYPCMLLSVGTAIFILLLVFVVPRFSGLFETLDVPLPGTTAALVALSEGLRQYWWLIVLVVGGVVTSLVVYLRTPKGRSFRDGAIVKMPGVGRIVQSFSTARIVSLLGMLMQARIPVLEALGLVKQSAGNVRYRDLVSRAESCVAGGEPMSSAFADASLISPSVCQAIRSGEASGEIDRLLMNISTFLEEENEVIIRSLTSIMEPAILIVMGLLVGLISVCMFMPLFDLTSMTQGGG